jgi:hypothetical protein
MDKTLAESIRILGRISRDYEHFIIRQRKDEWLDFVSNGLRPVAISQGPRDEALMFRIFIDEFRHLSIKIHWDNGNVDSLNPSSSNRLYAFIELYYPPFDSNEEELVERQILELKRINEVMPFMVCWMKIACCEVAVKIAQLVETKAAEDEFRKKKLIETEKVKSHEATMVQKRVLEILKKDLDTSIREFEGMDAGNKLRIQNSIRGVLSKEKKEMTSDAVALCRNLNCLDEILNFENLESVQHALGIIRQDFDDVFRHIVHKPFDNVILLHTEFCKETSCEVSEILTKIAHHSEIHEHCIRKELARLIRSMIQFIFRAYHLSGNKKKMNLKSQPR